MPDPKKPEERTFASHSGACAASYFPAATTDLTGPKGRPCIVMAHGFGATRHSGLLEFAQQFADAGADALAFDYRGFGESSHAVPRLIDASAQLADYRAAIAYARSLPEVDPDRVGVWGVSFSGGHVFALAATDVRLAAAIAVTPACDGLAATRVLAQTVPPRVLLTLLGTAVRDRINAARGRDVVSLPISGEPGTAAFITAPGMGAAYARIAGPDWVNDTPARVALSLGLYRPGKQAGAVRCPMLVQIADNDQIAPPSAARKAAFAARAEVRAYPCDHFDVYPGAQWYDAVVKHSVSFLQRVLAPKPEPAGMTETTA